MESVKKITDHFWTFEEDGVRSFLFEGTDRAMLVEQNRRMLLSGGTIQVGTISMFGPGSRPGPCPAKNIPAAR